MTGPWQRPTYRALTCPECKQPFQPLGAGHMSGCTIGQRYVVPELADKESTWRFLVFGTRDHPPVIYPKVFGFLDDVLAKHPNLVIMHGGAQGIDRLGGRWASENGVATEVWKPQYELFNKWRAPFWRNAEMAARRPDGALGAIGPCRGGGCRATYPHGTHGSSDMVVKALAVGVPVYPMVWGGLDELAAWIRTGRTD